MHSILGQGSFSISEVWHGSDQPVALLRHYWAFSLSVLLDRLFLIFLLKISHKALPSVWIGFAWQYSQAWGHPCCLCTFSYPISSFQSTLHLICFDTELCEQPPLSLMTFCVLPSLWRVSMIVFWTIAKSAVFSIILVSKNKRYPAFMDFWLSWAVSSNHQN